MTERAFWEIIERSRASASTTKEVPDRIEDHLASMALEEIMDFSAWTATCLNRLNDERISLAGAVICNVSGAMADDSLLYFQCWLIAQGKGTFEAALADPDSLAEVSTFDDGILGPSPFLERLLDVTIKPFRMKSGGKNPSEYRAVLPSWKPPRGSRASRTEMASRDFWDGDKSTLRKLFPRLTARFLSLILVALTLSATLTSSSSSP